MKEYIAIGVIAAIICLVLEYPVMLYFGGDVTVVPFTALGVLAGWLGIGVIKKYFKVS